MIFFADGTLGFWHLLCQYWTYLLRVQDIVSISLERILIFFSLTHSHATHICAEWVRHMSCFKINVKRRSLWEFLAVLSLLTGKNYGELRTLTRKFKKWEDLEFIIKLSESARIMLWSFVGIDKYGWVGFTK